MKILSIYRHPNLNLIKIKRSSIFTSDKCPSKLWVTRSSYDISSTYFEIRSALDRFIKLNKFSREDLRFRITVGKLHIQTRLFALH